MSIRALTAPPKILAGPLASDGTRLILPDIKAWDGNDIAYATLGTVLYVTLQDFARTKMEIIEVDPSTMNVATTTGVLINKRALSFQGGTTADVETAYDWTSNETYVLLGSNPPQLHENYVDLDEAQTITGVKTFNKDTGRPKLSADEDTAVDEEFVSFGQLARQAIAGAADASTTVAGLTEEGTAAEATAGTDAGSVARLFLTPGTLAAQIQSGSWLYAVEDGTGSDDTYTATLTPTLTTYTAGQLIMVKLTVANAGACTLNIDSVGAKNIKKYVSGAKGDPETGDIVADQHCLFVYDGTDMVLLNPSAGIPDLAALQEAETFFEATDITGAEAETLTSGAASDATSKHKHNTVKTHQDTLSVSDQSETTLATYTVAANRLGTESGGRIRWWVTTTGNNGSKTIRIKFGSTTVSTITVAASTTGVLSRGEAWFFNAGATGSQEWVVNATNINDIGGTEALSQETITRTTSSEDTTGALALAITIQRADSGDTCTGSAYIEILDKE